MTSSLSYCIELSNPALEDVFGITSRMLGALRDHGISDSRFLSELDLAATEAINNAIEHGCCGVADPSISACLSMSPGQVEVTITDPSQFQGWEGAASLPDDLRAEGGRGRFLIEQLTSSARHDVLNGRHRLILTKQFWPHLAWSYEPGSHDEVLAAMTEEVGASYEMINALIGLGELLAGAGEVETFLQLALGRVCELTGAEAAFVRMDRPAGLHLEGQVGNLPGPVPELLPADGTGMEVRVFQTGEELTLTSPPADGDPLAGLVSAAFVAPILYKSSRRGVLVLAQSHGDRPFFTAAQLQVARVVGEYLGIVAAINELQQRRESEQRALRELEIAAEIQMSLMPQEFQFSEHLEAFGMCRPALKAGGDYFDFLPLPDGGLLVVCADVMGKGVSAALLANMLRTNIRALAHHAGDPGRLLTEVNANMAPDLRRLEMFITVGCAWISPDGARICEASAGHPSGILCHDGGTTSVLKSQGFPIGILEKTHYETHLVDFAVGDVLILFTDGIPEAGDKDGAFFEEAGLLRAVTKAPIRKAAEFVRQVLDQVDEFSAHAPPTDDRTIVTVIRTS